MILPRLTIGKILVKIYEAIHYKRVVNFMYNDKLICIDGEGCMLYSREKPEYMLATLFSVTQLAEDIYQFDMTTLYYQLVGKEPTPDSIITYLKSRYDTPEERIRHYVDFTLNN